MTSNMLQVLKDASKRPLRRVHHTGPGNAAWPAHSSTLAALVREGFLDRQERLSRHGEHLDEWTVTELGREALKAPERVAVERPVFLARPTRHSGDYTCNPARRIDPLEVVGEASLVWRRRAESERLGAKDRRGVARDLARQARRAA